MQKAVACKSQLLASKRIATTHFSSSRGITFQSEVQKACVSHLQGTLLAASIVIPSLADVGITIQCGDGICRERCVEPSQRGAFRDWSPHGLQ